MEDISKMPPLFSVPRHIFLMEGMTFAYIRVYEVIYQFLCRGRSCYLGNDEIQRRADVSYSQMKAAFKYFEQKNLLQRVSINGQRYITIPQPELKIDDEDCLKDDQNQSKPVDNFDEGCRFSDGGGVGSPTVEGVGSPTPSKALSFKQYSKKQCKATAKEFLKIPKALAEVITPETERIASAKNFNLEIGFKKFQDFYVKKNINCKDWQAQFKKWVIDERTEKSDPSGREKRSTVPKVGNSWQDTD